MSDDERHLRNLETYPDQRIGRPAPAVLVGVQPEPAEDMDAPCPECGHRIGTHRWAGPGCNVVGCDCSTDFPDTPAVPVVHPEPAEECPHCGNGGHEAAICGWRERPAAPVVHPEPGDRPMTERTAAEDDERERTWALATGDAVLAAAIYTTSIASHPLMLLADAEVAAAVAAVRADTEAERDLIHADLTDLVNALGMGDHARPYSSHQLMQEAIANVRVLAGQVAAIRAPPEWQDCNCAEDSRVGIEHHAVRRGYNEALAVVRAALVASSPTTPEAPK